MKKIAKIEAILLCLALILGMCVTGYEVQAKASWTDSKIEEEYEIFSEFTVPQRQLTVGKKKADAQAVVTLPDGTSTKADTIKLKSAGQYTVTYSAKVDGKAYAEEETFIVHNNLYGFTSEDSSAVYGQYEHSKETKGLMIRLAEGDKLTLNEPLDFSSMKSDEWLIQAFATPDTVGYADFRKLCFQLTDVDDPSVTLYFSAKQTGENDILPYTYCVVGGNDQTPKGMEIGSGKIWEEGSYGAVALHSFGLGHEYCTEYCDEQMIQFRVDFSSMAVYIKQGMMADLDSAEYFDTVWEGFPSGKAYLTIWADRYASSSANFCLVKAGNVDLTQTVVEDTEPPVITIDSKYEEMPSAVKGGCYQYIPTATAKDMTSGECEVTTKVYYNYQQPGHTVLDVKNGTFKTDKYGYYAIVYEATDIFGNLAQEILWIKAEKNLQTPTIELTETQETKWTQGEKFIPKAYKTTSYNGDEVVNVYAKKDGKTYKLNDGYRFEKEGTYHIIYEVKDCAGQTATAEYDMTVKTGDSPVLGQDVSFPKYMMEETEYTFPKVTFCDYRSGKKEKKTATGKIVDANGTKEVKAGEKFTLAVDKNGDTATIIFVCENGSYEVKLPVIKTWGQDEKGRAKMLLENFFIGTGTSYSQGEQVTFTATAADGEWTYANELLAENFSMSLAAVQGATDYSALVIRVRDSKNAEETLEFKLPNDADIFAVQSGTHTQTLRKGTNIASAGEINVTFKDGSLYVAGTKIKNVTVPEFTSGYLYLSVEFEGAGNHAQYQLLSLNNHAFGSSKTDKVAPKIVIRGDYGGSYSYMDEITLPSAVAGDTLNPNITFTMTVNIGDKIVKDVNGKELKDVDPTKEYVIKVDKYGKYNISYTAYESYSEKEASASYMIHITDDVKPTVTFKQKKVTEAQVGDVLCIPDYTVSDNETKAEDIKVMKYVEDPNGHVLQMTGKSNAVKATQEGTYKLIVLAVDEVGNICNESWKITVTAKK